MTKVNNVDPTRRILPKLYTIIKQLGFAEGSDEFLGIQAAFILGQQHMQDLAIDRLGDFEAVKCAQVVASLRIHSGFEKAAETAKLVIAK